MKKIVLLIIVVIGAIYFFTTKNESPDDWVDSLDHQEHEHKHDKDKDDHKSQTSSPKKNSPKKKASAKVQEAQKDDPYYDSLEKEEKSFYRVHKKLAKIYDKTNSDVELIQYLEDNGLGPKVARNSNPYTGSMTMIRSSKGFAGTRYYHAQYVTDEQGDSHLQHMSTEFRPGPQAFEKARDMVEKVYGVKNGKLSRDGRFVQYKLGDSRVLWVNEMNEEDLKGDLLNAHDVKTDVGTIKAAIELEIHGDDREDADHIHPEN